MRSLAHDGWAHNKTRDHFDRFTINTNAPFRCLLLHSPVCIGLSNGYNVFVHCACAWNAMQSHRTSRVDSEFCFKLFFQCIIVQSALQLNGTENRQRDRELRRWWENRKGNNKIPPRVFISRLCNRVRLFSSFAYEVFVLLSEDLFA